MINEGDWQLGLYGLTWQSADSWIRAFPEGVEALHNPPSADVLAATMDEPPFSLNVTRPLLRDHTFADWRDVLPRITVAVTAMAGRHSPVWPWESAQWMADAAPEGSSCCSTIAATSPCSKSRLPSTPPFAPQPLASE